MCSLKADFTVVGVKSSNILKIDVKLKWNTREQYSNTLYSKLAHCDVVVSTYP